MNKKFRIIVLLLVLMLIAVGLIGCSQKEEDSGQAIEEPNGQEKENLDVEIETSEFPVVVEDGFGNIVNIQEVPERIVSLAPSHTEILYALNLGDKMVGVTAFCDYPAEALEVEKIGDYMGINFEKIIELEPDLIVNYGQLDEDASQIYSDAGIPVISFLAESIDEVLVTIKQIALATDKVEEGDTLVKSMEDHRDEIVSKVQTADTVKVFYEIWHDPLMAAGAGSFTDSLINLANGVNVASDAEGEYPNYDIEQLIENDPQVYLTAMDSPDKTVESIAARPGYDNITAVKNGYIYILDGNILSRPGPRIVEALEIIARTLHPQVFE